MYQKIKAKFKANPTIFYAVPSLHHGQESAP